MRCLALSYLSLIETLRRKEFYVVLVLIALLAGWLQMANLGASQAGRFSREIVMQVAWLASFALAVALATRQIPTDVEQRTAYILLARPIPRWQYIAGRGLGAVSAAITCFTGLFLILIVMLAIRGGAGVLDATLWQAYALQVCALTLLCSISLCLSCAFSPAAAVTFALVLLCVTRYGGQSLMSAIETMTGMRQYAAWAAYLALPHFEFFDISRRFVHGWGPLPKIAFVQILAYGLGYALFAGACASLTFRRKWL
ncbi:MAG: ABC-2 transporter permease [Armatimonadetes bacterium]|nr:ABC-2 transporter permease [Armatimonadota bacterium]